MRIAKKEKKNFSIFDFIYLILIIIITNNFIKLNNITNTINNNEIYYNEKFNNIIKRIKNIEINYPSNDEIINFINRDIKHSLNKEINSSKLLYNALLDGDSVKQFHQKCDGHENTLTIIRTDQGKIFGGFTILLWENKYKYYKVEEDNKGFLFSYDKKEIYYINKNQKAEIWTGSGDGPTFGSLELVISDNCLHNTDCFDETGKKYASFNTNGQRYVLNDGPFFKVLNYEVYELFFK